MKQPHYTEAGRAGGLATADKMRADPKADVQWRKNVGAASTDRFRDPAFKARHAAACKAAALRRWQSAEPGGGKD
ncbi:hypothetical protein [Sulfitobacter donghicola]|nr:hypothetical protein [Sulfitobacter donghicola]